MITSRLITYKNIYNKKIIGIYDHDESQKQPRPVIIIPPAFGETKTDSLSLSYFLVRNGFNVLRYDSTNHTGESDGNIFNFTLGDGKNDLMCAMDFLCREYGDDSFGIVAKSLAWTYSLKTAVSDRRIKYLLGIGGIVNLQDTIKSIYVEDLVDIVAENKYKYYKFPDMFGFEIGVNFLETAIRENYHNLSNTKKDFNRLKIPASYLYAENDVWVNIHDVKTVMARKKSDSELRIVNGALHQIDENPAAALFVFRQVVVSCKKHICKEDIDHDEVVKPSSSEVARRNRIEKARLRKYELTREDERIFWKRYLTSYSFIDKIQDFREYLNTIINIFGEIRKDEAILDAGCGPGYFGSWLMGQNQDEFPRYFGLDIVRSVLKHTKSRHEKFHEKISHNGPPGQDGLTLSYICSDLDIVRNNKRDSHICLKNNSFDKICCSLLVSYLREPSSFLRECYRILKPGGKIIVSSLKPYADLSQIYHKFTSQTRNKIYLRKARRLLSDAGMIKQKESQGYYQFYSEDNLTRLLHTSEFKKIKCYRTFCNQVNLAVAMK